MRSGALKNWFWFAVFFLSATIGISCSENDEFPFNQLYSSAQSSSSIMSSSAAEISSSSKNHEGFVLINAKGKSTYLGTDEKGVRKSETPKMEVKFTYDFYIAEHEVTRGEYNALREKFGGECDGKCSDSIPVTNVTFFDAVLYANAKSKAENLDTVYTYKSASFSESGSCNELVGFAFHENVNGYRLPTEAEWVYVASQGWNPEYGWNSENSGHEIHDVMKLPANGFGVYDMAGNAVEWVNDWLTYFRTEPLTNFVGGSDGGSLGERVVKGGSFRNEILMINTYTRGDIYTITSSTKGDYLGFRLAFGAIPKATWLDESGTAKESVINVSTETYELKHLTGTFENKLVFRDDVTGHLSYIDFGLGLNSIVEIKDSLRAYHPDISPDGKRVAFCTGTEGVSGKSSVYVRNLDETGSGLVKLDVENAAIPRWRVLENGDTVIVYVSSAANNKDNASFAEMSTWQVSFSNGKFATPQKLFDGAYHGGVSDDGTLAVTGARLLRVRLADSGNVLANVHDTVWYGGEQACNVSLANDGSKRTLFLDFGGKTGAAFVGQSYRTHERLLVMNAKGELIQSIAAPQGYTFDHTEWVLGGSNFAVASLVNLNGAHQKIVLIDLTKGTVNAIAEGDELWHPCLWHSRINFNSENLDTDSAGIYYTPSAYYSALELRVKMERFWENRDKITAVALGSSRTMFGLYDKEITSYNLLNMSFSNAQMTGINYLFTNYVMNHLKNLKVLVIEMSPDFLWYPGFATWTDAIYDKVPGFKYDENHKFWVDGLPDHFIDALKVTPRPETALMHPYNLDDFLLPTMEWGPPVFIRDTTEQNFDFPVYLENFNTFKQIVATARARNIKVVVTVMPQDPAYSKTGAFGVYGPRRSVAYNVLDTVKSLDVVFFDENKFGNHDYTDEMAYNVDHLSTLGAKQFTHRLDSLLSTLGE